MNHHHPSVGQVFECFGVGLAVVAAVIAVVVAVAFLFYLAEVPVKRWFLKASPHRQSRSSGGLVVSGIIRHFCGVLPGLRDLPDIGGQMNPSTPDVRNLDVNEAINQAREVAPQGAAGVSGTVEGHGAERLKATTTSGEPKKRSTGSWPSQEECIRKTLASGATISASPADSQISDIASAEFATPAGDPGISTPVGMPGNSVSRGHGVQGDPATAASCTTLALETAAGIQLEELAEVCGEGETGWNAQRRNAIARKMQRIAANCPNRYSEDELVSTVARAERGELRS